MPFEGSNLQGIVEVAFLVSGCIFCVHPLTVYVHPPKKPVLRKKSLNLY